jgi:hypothetical protein
LLKLPRTVAWVFSGWGIEWKNMDDKEPFWLIGWLNEH